MTVHGWQGWVAFAAAMTCAFAGLVVFAGFALAVANASQRRRRRARRGGLIQPSPVDPSAGWEPAPLGRRRAGG